MLDLYPSSPGASSSRVTLDDLAEIDLNGPSAPIPPTLRRRRRPSTHARRVATFALSLCLPYITSADALPSPHSPLLLPPAPPPSPPSARWVRLSRHLLTRTNAILVAGDYKKANSESVTVPWDWVILEQRFQPGFIVLSYLIAFVGSLCTLELLLRRTSNHGWRNQCLLAAAGICFGSVSTFSMHFIFNQALTLHSPAIQDNEALALIYGPGYTVLSLVASCAAMTIAFFVMGTDLGNWCCVYGLPRSSRRKEKENQRQADEYKKWKMAHIKKGEMLSKSAKGMGALVSAAGKVAKWSLVEDPNREEEFTKGGWLSPLGKMGKGKVADEERDWEDGQMTSRTTGTLKSAQDEAIAKDKRLSEIEFRQGRDAAVAEIARRETPTPKNRRQSGKSVRHVASAASLPAVPAPAAFFGRRGSVPAHLTGVGFGGGGGFGNNADFSHSTTEVFLPGYNFPPRVDSSTADLLRESVPDSPRESEGSPSFARPASFDIPPHPTFDYASRRASLPTVNPATREAMFSSSLSRIQSLPEADQDAHSAHSPPLGGFTSPSFSHKDTQMEDGLEVKDHDDVAESKADQAEAHRAKKARRWERNGWGVKVQKFLGFDVVTKEEAFKIVLTGTIAGFGVAAMHYIGQLSIVGMPWIQYDPAFVVGSVIIAAGAVVIALYIMFIMLRPKLKHGFLYKICVAVILAIAVCCMHFCGMMGTTYAWPINTPITKHDLLGGTNGAIVGIVTALALTACLACGVFFAFEAIQARRERLRRRRVVVASIMFDEQDRILVNSTDGLPPMCDIASLSGAGETTLKSSKRSSSRESLSSSGASTVLGMDLTPGHEAFVNALRLSWFWRNPQYSALNPFNKDRDTISTSGTAPAVSNMNLSLSEIRRGSMQTINSSTIGGSVRPSRLSVNKFLERFVISAGQLAVRLTGQEDGIQRLGVLYDQILTTGWVKLTNSSDTVSKGQLIMLVRRVTAQQERADLLTRHYIFADASAVAVALQRTLSVPLEHMNPLLSDVLRFCDTTTRVDLQPGTLYAGVAIVQATPFDGLRILLEDKTRSQLPMRELCTFTSSTMSRLSHNTGATEELGGSVEDIGEALTWLEGMNLLSIIGRNVATAQYPARESVGGPIVAQLLRYIERTIVPMLDGMLSQDDMAHIIPRLALHPFLVPLTPHRPRSNPLISATNYIPPYMIVLYANYDAAVNTFTDKWLPFNLFRVQNSCVMAPYVGGEVAIPRGVPNGVTSDLPEGFNPGRRPSKVQFELSPSQLLQQQQQNTPSSSSPLANPYAPSYSPMSLGPETPDASSSFAGFAFPARNTTSPPPPPSSDPYAPSHTELGTPFSTPSAPMNVPAHRFKDRGGPRRSSLAKPRDFAYPPPVSTAIANPLQDLVSGPKSPTLYAGDRYAGAPGVGEWDPDWLLVLLRNKLRAEA